MPARRRVLQLAGLVGAAGCLSVPRSSQSFDLFVSNGASVALEPTVALIDDGEAFVTASLELAADASTERSFEQVPDEVRVRWRGTTEDRLVEPPPDCRFDGINVLVDRSEVAVTSTCG